MAIFGRGAQFSPATPFPRSAERSDRRRRPGLVGRCGGVRLAGRARHRDIRGGLGPESRGLAMPTREERYEAAESLKNGGQLAEAVALLEGVIADHPDFALAYSALAAWCTRLERHDDAVRHARRVCELEPKDPFSFTALSVACMRGGRIAEAEDALARSRMLQGG